MLTARRGSYFLTARKIDGTIDKGILLRMYGPIILVVTVIAVGISALLYVTVIYDSPQTISQELFLHERYLFHNPQDVTSQTCSTALPCVWASASDESTVMRIESKDEAGDFYTLHAVAHEGAQFSIGFVESGDIAECCAVDKGVASLPSPVEASGWMPVR